jgi:hypothetical protein
VPVWRHSDGWSALARMEKIMTKTDPESREVREPKERELWDDELALVSGGRGTIKAGYDIKQMKQV